MKNYITLKTSKGNPGQRPEGPKAISYQHINSTNINRRDFIRTTTLFTASALSVNLLANKPDKGVIHTAGTSTDLVPDAAAIEREIYANRPAPVVSFPADVKLCVNDFGAVASSTQNCYPAIVAALNAVKKENEAGKSAELYFNKGTYLVDSPANVWVFSFNKNKNIIINGNGSEIIFPESNAKLFELDDCKNIILKDFIVRYENDGQLAGEIVKIDTVNDTIDIKVEGKYRQTIAQKEKIFRHAEQKPWSWYWLAEEINGEYYPYHWVMRENGPVKFEVISEDTIRFFKNKGVTQKSFFKTGIKVIVPNKGTRTVKPTSSEDITISGITTYGSSSAFLFAVGCININVLNCKFLSDKKSLGIAAGGFVSVNSFGHWIEGNLIDGAGDDALNIVNQPGLFVRQKVSSHKVIMDYDGTVHRGRYADFNKFFKVGDVLEFQSRMKGTCICEAVITEIDQPRMIFTFDRELPDFYIISNKKKEDWYKSDCAYNKSLRTYDVVKNNVIKRAVGRGIGITGNYVLIENNTVDYTLSSAGLSAVTLGRNSNHYGSRNFVVKKNLFRECMARNVYPSESWEYVAAINFAARDYDFKKMKFKVNGNIYILDNTIESWYFNAIAVLGAQYVTIENNSIRSVSPKFAPGIWEGVRSKRPDQPEPTVFSLDDVSDARITHNTVSDTRPIKMLEQRGSVENLLFENNQHNAR
jgi:hypothetical protein